MSQSAASPTTSRTDGATGTIHGNLTDAGTGANLKGALITLIETGETTRSDDYGNFRFLNVPTGTKMIQVSYLGSTQSTVTVDVESGDGNQLSISLSDSMDEITVIGTRSARALSLNLQRTAANNAEVVSADLLGNFTGTTISEALRRVPGITFQQNSRTGEGTNIMVRGLGPDMNTVTLNGLRLPDNSGRGRSGDLSNILADSVSKITVNKSLLPSHDSSGTGGLVEIETKSPLDRPKRHFNASIEGGQSGDDFNDDLLASGTLSGMFGLENQFGLSLSVQHRERRFETIGQSQRFLFGQYLPLESDGSTSIIDHSQIDPRRLFPFEPGASNVYPRSQRIFNDVTDTSNLTVGLSAEWQVSPRTNWRLDVQNIDAETGFQGQDNSESYFSFYRPQPVVGLGGDTRQALMYFNALNTSRNQEARMTNSSTDAISYRGVSEPGNWTVEYGGGYAKGSQRGSTKNLSFTAFIFHDPTFVSPDAVDPIEGRVLAIFGPVTGGIQQPLLTQAGFDFLNDPALYRFSNAGANTFVSSNERKTAELSTRYTFGGDTVQYIEAGMFYETAEFDVESNPGRDTIPFYTGAGATAADLGLSINTNVLDRIGTGNGVGGFTTGNLDAELARLVVLANAGSGVTENLFSADARLAGEYTLEKELSGYLEAALNFGKLEIVGGVRVAQVKTTASKLQTPFLTRADGTRDTAFEQANTIVVQFDDTVTDVLPRMIANYRHSENLVVRGGYYYTVARPTISSLSKSPQISLSLAPFGGPANNQPTLNVNIGNPGLEPAVTHNFDLGVERYDDNIGVIKLGVFYKRINNFIDSNVTSGSSSLAGITLPDDPRFQNLPGDIFINVNRPRNAEDVAEIWGAEVAVEHRFSNLPGVLDGLGIYANYTFSDSKRDVTRSWFSSPVFDTNGVLTGREEIEYVREAPFFQQARNSGTVALTYERDSLDASLSYSAQARRLQALGAFGSDQFGFDQYHDQADSLDFRAEYRLSSDRGGQYRFWLEGQDLLDGSSDPTLKNSIGGVNGVPEVTTRRSYIGGRSIKLGVSATF